MTTQTEYLWPHLSNEKKETSPRMVCYPPKGGAAKNAPAVIIFPGGGYARQAPHEGEPVARFFADNGFFAFVLFYRVAPDKFPAPYDDAARGVRMVRSRASEFGINPKRIAVMGFSAGGHLASLMATRSDDFPSQTDDLAGKVSARPDGVILGYPVISFVRFPHLGSCNNLLGPEADLKERKKFSTHLWVSEKTPPTFIFHTADDAAVPVENAYLFAEACALHNVPVELHVFPNGVHGVGLAENNPRLSVWPGLLMAWAKEWAGMI